MRLARGIVEYTNLCTVSRRFKRIIVACELSNCYSPLKYYSIFLALPNLQEVVLDGYDVSGEIEYKDRYIWLQPYT